MVASSLLDPMTEFVRSNHVKADKSPKFLSSEQLRIYRISYGLISCLCTCSKFDYFENCGHGWIRIHKLIDKVYIANDLP